MASKKGRERTDMKRKIAIFDFDGVAADSAPFYCERYGMVAKMFNKPYPVKSMDDFRKWYDSAWENNYRNLGFSDEEIREAVKVVRRKESYSDVPIFPGFKEAMKTITSRHLTAIASCTALKVIERKLVEEEMDGDFAFISGGDGHGSDKREIVQAALDHFSIRPEDAVMIGDTEMDVRSAAACGIRAIGTAYGWNTPERLIKAGAKSIAYKPSDLPDLIDEMLA